MWGCIFKRATGIGSGINRDPDADELRVELPKEICGWFNIYPSRYRYVGGKFSERPEWATEVAAKEAADALVIADLQARVTEIENAQESAGLKEYTVAQAQAWINNELDSAANAVEIKAAVKKILLKMVPYLLN